jgi:hypothetical protein
VDNGEDSTRNLRKELKLEVNHEFQNEFKQTESVLFESFTRQSRNELISQQLFIVLTFTFLSAYFIGQFLMSQEIFAQIKKSVEVMDAVFYRVGSAENSMQGIMATYI